MEVGIDIEDDLFFADLNKQISLLIMDDEDDHHHHPLAHTASASLQVLSRDIYPATQPQYSYHQTCTRESKGTGVFIPQSSISHQRRRNRQAKNSSSSNSKYHKKQNNEYSRGMINYSHGSYINYVPPNNSFNIKKHVDYR